MSVLDEIVGAARLRAEKPDVDYLRRLETMLYNCLKKPALPFPKSAAGGNIIIAEVKKASPSLGGISEAADVAGVAADYAAGGAAAVSVLTEPTKFAGSLKDLAVARSACTLPILRKDFIVSELQLKEARAYGADCVLLIASILGEELKGMIDAARKLGLWSLVEVHTKAEVEDALEAGAEIIGVNNRDLETLKVDLKTSVELCEMIPKNKIFISESGINSADDIKFLKEECARKPDAYLVGGALMKAEEKEKLLKALVDA